MARFGAWAAKLVSEANNWGVKRNIDLELSQLMPKIEHDLAFAGEGGVLVVARVAVVQTESGSYHSLIGGHVDYVGIGESAADAELRRILRAETKLTGAQRPDANATRAFFFKKSAGGSLKRTELSGSLLRQQAIGLYGKRTLEGYDWKAARDAELTRFLTVLETRIQERGVRLRLEAIQSEYQEVQARLDKINEELNAALEDASAAANARGFIDGLASAADVANFAFSISKDMSPNGKATVSSATSKAELEAALHDVEETSTSTAQTLREAQIKALEDHGRVQTNILIFSQEHKLPVQNLSPGGEPVFPGPDQPLR